VYFYLFVILLVPWNPAFKFVRRFKNLRQSNDELQTEETRSVDLPVPLQTVLNLIGNGENKNKYLIVGEIVDEVELMTEADDIHILKPALNLIQITKKAILLNSLAGSKGVPLSAKSLSLPLTYFMRTTSFLENAWAVVQVLRPPQ
jgi:hypothetical protein